jgi:Tfp pilus assembly protein PilO
MARAITIVFVALLAAVAGVGAGYWLWGRAAQQVPLLETRTQSLQHDLRDLQSHAQNLEQHLEQVTKEQERLAQENAILRQERTTKELLGEAPFGTTPEPTPPK